MSLYGNREFASGNQKPNYANTGNVYGISTTEKSNTGGLNYGPKLTHSGWVQFSLGTGGIQEIRVNNAGRGYNSNGYLIIAGGNGSGANASFTSYNASNQQVTSIAIGGGGTGYNVDGFLIFTGGGGSGANASFGRNTVAAAANSINSVTLIARGAGYTSAPTVTAQGSNITPASFTASILPANGVLVVTINNPGSGYNAAPTSITANLGNTVAATFDVTMGGRTGRIVNEVLVASGSISGDVDDASGFFTG